VGFDVRPSGSSH
jgi:hypothetical protein